MLNMLPRIIYPREMVIKKGSLIRLKFLDGKKAFIICGGQSFEKSGYLEILEKHLAASKIEIVTVKRIIKDPTEDSINTIMTQLKDLNADWIIGVGGGAVMDTAKLIYALYENQNIPLSDFKAPHSVPELRKKAKLCLIPTTAGSGSEVSNSAVVTIDNKKIRVSKDGYFAFGLDRDRKNNVIITIRESGKINSSLPDLALQTTFDKYSKFT